MTYTIVVVKTVQKQLDNLPGVVSPRIYAKIQQLAENPRPSGVIKLKAFDNQYRVRVGDYRIRYAIDDANLVIRLLQCKHRKDIYKDQS
jgi:mRNA interferase RelE/StbE